MSGHGVASFAADAAVGRRPEWGRGLAGVAGAAGLGCIVWAFADGLRARLGLFAMGTAVYRDAQWASTAAIASFVAAGTALAVWLLARFLRAALGVPVRPLTRRRARFAKLRAAAAVPMLLILAVWSLDEILVRGVRGAPFVALGLGAVTSLLLAYDVPRLARNGLAALRERTPLLGIPFHELDALPAAGLVRTRGVVAAGDDTLWTAQGACVWLRRTADPTPLGRESESLEARPFRLEHRGARVFVDLDPARALVVTPAALDPVAAEVGLPVGAPVEVIGAVIAGEAGAYRGAPPRLGPTPGPRGRLFVFAGPRGAMNRRLVLAAAVDLLAAAGLLGSVLFLAVAWSYLGFLARR
ncbi:MAG TPA: hypothetical protein VG389_05755 [Myxococcota bacterium]|jgi:hypothetical protein|nr:hypothetical protein [Myxococcota bacterium]